MTRKLIAASFLAATALASANASAYTIKYQEPTLHSQASHSGNHRCDAPPHDQVVVSHSVYHHKYHGRPFRSI
jgi:hypothetical protein